MENLTQEQAAIMNDSIEMLQKKKKDKAIAKYEEENKKKSSLNIMLATLSKDDDDDDEDSECAVEKAAENQEAGFQTSDQEKAKTTQPQKHEEKFFDISEKIENEISKNTRMIIEKETGNITNATTRAISLRAAQADNAEYGDLVIKALEETIKERTSCISDAFLVEIEKEIDESTVKRLDFNKIYSEFLEVMYISKKTTKDMINDAIILDMEMLQMKYMGTNGFLSLPLEYYKKNLEVVSLSEELAGKDLRGMEIHAKFLENAAVVNLFKEDIFDIF